jgi:hypothetical protein
MPSRTPTITKSHLAAFVEYRTHRKLHQFYPRPEFRIKPEYSEEQELIDVIAEFRKAYAQQQIDTEGYISFLKSYGEYLVIEKPSTWDNISFMFEYQFGYMYWRYLMWNFTGRQNDIQGKYDNLDGNWLSGVKFVDEAHWAPRQSPRRRPKQQGRNMYYFLPFILGLIGIFYHANKDLKSFMCF